MRLLIVIVVVLLPGLAWAEAGTANGIAPITRPAAAASLHSCTNGYPGAMQIIGAQGTTLLSYFITADGGVRAIKVERSSGHRELDDAAAICVKTWRYIPAMQNGRKVEVPWSAQVVWKLHNNYTPEQMLQVVLDLIAMGIAALLWLDFIILGG